MRDCDCCVRLVYSHPGVSASLTVRSKRSVSAMLCCWRIPVHERSRLGGLAGNRIYGKDLIQSCRAGPTASLGSCNAVAVGSIRRAIEAAGTLEKTKDDV